jgi:hypothetical protein
MLRGTSLTFSFALDWDEGLGCKFWGRKVMIELGRAHKVGHNVTVGLMEGVTLISKQNFSRNRYEGVSQLDLIYVLSLGHWSLKLLTHCYKILKHVLLYD